MLRAGCRAAFPAAPLCRHRARALPWARPIFGVGFARCKLDIVGMGLGAPLQLLKSGQRTWPHTHAHVP